MASVSNVIKILKADYDALVAAGSTGYVINGTRYYYDPNAMYLVDGDSSGGSTDVQINGTSITSSGVANILYATGSVAGVVSTGTQTFAGQKKFIGDILVGDPDYPSAHLKLFDPDTDLYWTVTAQHDEFSVANSSYSDYFTVNVYDKYLQVKNYADNTTYTYNLPASSGTLALKKYKHNLTITFSTNAIVTFSFINTRSTTYGTGSTTNYTTLVTDLIAAGFTNASYLCPASGQFYTSANIATNIVIGVYGSSSTLGVRYVTIASTSGTTMTINQQVSNNNSLITASPDYLYDVVEVC